MPVISGSSTISGITNLSPRINSRAIDNAPGRYPTTLGTADPDRRGKIYKSFDDTYTISFLSRSSETADMGLVQYPVKLLSSSQLDKFGPFSSSPNIESDLFATASVQAGISDDILMHNIRTGYHELGTDRRNFKWIPSNNHFINEEEPKPFSDDRIYIGTSSFYHTGTVISYGGLRSKLASKISFKVDISSNEDRVLTKRVKAKLDVADPSGEFNGKDITGFCYYNFSTKKWDQIGLTDPATGNPIPYDFACQSILSNFSQNARRQVHSGTNNFPMQFKPSFHFVPDDESQRLDLGYGAIGTPTVTSFAPFSTKYHATGNQTISMSEYINHPFVLEKIAVNLPVTAQRKIKVQDAAGNLTLDGSRDQDDYVFFIYRQSNRTHPRHAVDSKFDVSGSERFLVCSGVMTFYNDTICERNSLNTRAFEPINTPAFSHNFGIALEPSSVQPDDDEKTGVYSGSIRLDLTPSFFNKRLSGRSVTPRAIDEPAAAKPENVNVGGMEIFHYWPGGSSALPFMQESGSYAILSSKKDFSPAPSKYTGKVGVSASYGKTQTNQTFLNIEAESVTAVQLPVEVFDPRVTEGYGGISDPKTNSFGVMVGGASTIESPYLLLPGDKLIFGMDAAMGTAIGMAGGGPGIASGTMMTGLTGSRLTITTGPASITFFGSLLRNGSGISNMSLNQQLTSDNVHSSIQQDLTITDQFDIDLPSALTGTYIDLTHKSPPGASVHGLVARNAANEILGPTKVVLGRKVVGSFAGGTMGTTGSLLRGVRLSDGTERFWDTVMPSIREYTSRIPSPPDQQYNAPKNIIEFAPGVTDASAVMPYLTGTFLSEVSSSLPYPYQGNPTRNPIDFAKISYGTPGANILIKLDDPEDVARVLFSRGWDFHPANGIPSAKIRHALQGASGMRYGVLNFRPYYSSAVFRRDRFGQFRDMLEQRPYAKFYKAGLKDGSLSPVEVRFVQVLTNQAMDPDRIVQKESDSSSSETFGSQVKKSSQSRNISIIASSSIPFVDRELEEAGPNE